MHGIVATRPIWSVAEPIAPAVDAGGGEMPRLAVSSHPPPARVSGSVILSGAGISVPAGLPSTVALAELIVSGLLAGPTVFSETLQNEIVGRLRAATIDQGLTSDQSTIRFEVMLDLLGRELPLATCVSAYSAVCAEAWDFYHLALQALEPKEILTVNIDTCHEQAAGALNMEFNVTHLHGSCCDLGDVATTLAAHAAGASRMADLMLGAVHDNDLIVIGYSGRDIDVMPAVIASGARRIIWFAYEGGHSPELVSASRQLGGSLVVTSYPAAAWLADQVGEKRGTELHLMETKVDASTSLPPEAKEAYENFATLPRNLAIGRLVEHFGFYKEAREAYARLAAEHGRDNNLLLAIARAEVALGNPRRARRMSRSAFYGSAITGRRGVALRAANSYFNALSEESRNRRLIAMLRPLERLAHLASRVAMGQRVARTHGQLASHLARAVRNQGRDAAAIDIYCRALDSMQRARDIDGMIDAMTWLADAKRATGSLGHALRLCGAALEDADRFARHYSAAWPTMLVGRILTHAGRLQLAEQSLLLARERFTQANSHLGVLWTELYLADLLLEFDLTRARSSVMQARELLTNSTWVLHAWARVWLLLAEIARLEGHQDEMNEHLKMTSKQLRSFDKAPKYLQLHRELIGAEALRQRGERSAISALRAARFGYQRISYHPAMIRTEVSLVLARDPETDPQQIKIECLRHGYELELRALQNDDPNAAYPIHFV